MRKKRAILILIVLMIISAILLLQYNLQSRKLKNLGLNSPFLNTFSLTKKNIVKSKNGTISFLYFVKQEEKVKIKKIQPVSKKQAIKKFNDKSVLIESVFHLKPAPYFAVLTKEINCPKEFLPLFRKKEGLWQSWTMFANQRQGFGVCDKSEIFFLNHKLLRYCPKKEFFFEIDYFVPYKTPLKKENSLKKEALLKLEKLIFCFSKIQPTNYQIEKI